MDPMANFLIHCTICGKDYAEASYEHPCNAAKFHWKEWVYNNVPLIIKIPAAAIAFVVCVVGTLLLPRRIWIKWWDWE